MEKRRSHGSLVDPPIQSEPMPTPAIDASRSLPFPDADGPEARFDAPTGLPAGARNAIYGEAPYLSVLPISVNTVLTLVPTVCTAVIMKTAIREAISAYSIAVAPDTVGGEVPDRLEHYLLLKRKPYPAANSVLRAARHRQKVSLSTFNRVNSILAG